MPFIIRYPAQTPKGIIDKQTVLCATDLLPTFLSLAGRKASSQSDGEDMATVFTGKPRSRTKPILWEYGRNNESFNYPAGSDKSPNLAMRQGNWKLLINDDGSKVELYDLLSDPSETNNLSGQQPRVVDQLKTQLLAWRKALPTVDQKAETRRNK